MRKIEIREIIPPIFYKIANYFWKKLLKLQGKPIRLHPFDSIPADINVKWILDIGANIGDVAIAALNSYPNSQVICFEPVDKTFQILTKRMEPFSKRSHLYNFALSDREEEGEINITTFHGANSISPQAKFHQDLNPHVRELGKENIHLVRLDDFSIKLPNEKIDIMKIDVEGHELEVLKGGARFISQYVDIILIEISLMRDQSLGNQAVFKIFALLNDLGFCLINVMDLHHVKDKEMQLVQMDCVFRNTKNLSISPSARTTIGEKSHSKKWSELQK